MLDFWSATGPSRPGHFDRVAMIKYSFVTHNFTRKTVTENVDAIAGSENTHVPETYPFGV